MTPERKDIIIKTLNNRQPDLTVVLENVGDPGNVSAVMRTCDAVGVREIYVLNTKILDHKKYSRKSSSGALKWLIVHQFNNTEACMQAVRKRYSKIYATHMASEAISLYQMDLTQSIALVFGNEKTGVSEECLPYCDGNFIIPQVGVVSSLNISVACAVTLYEAYRQRAEKGFYNGTSRMTESEWNELAHKLKMDSRT